MYDVVIIGAGVSGCAIARELAKYRGRICVLERSGGCLHRNLQSQQRHHPCRA